MIPSVEPTKAQFTFTDSQGAQKVPVNFNPASLDYSITVNNQGEGGKAQQSTGPASAKLNLELIFDTTDSGDDVRAKTNKVERMLQTSKGKGKDAPPQVLTEVTFEWGAFKFTGVVDSFKQTMDFFSAKGVPLRATVALSMSQKEYKFDQAGGTEKMDVDQALVLSDGDPSQLASDAGDPTAARDIASANGLESLRASAGAEVSVGGSISIGAAASFSAGAGANAGLGADFGLGASAGAGAGLSLGGGVGASADFSAGIGGSASAGVSATAGAFGGLHTEAGVSGGKYLEPDRLLATASAPGIAPGALFDVTGKAVAQSSSTFKADVGATGSLRFDAN